MRSILDIVGPAGVRSALDTPQLGPWVVLHEEPCRKYRFFNVAVNTRDGVAVQLEDDDMEVIRKVDGSHRLDDLCTTAGASSLLHELYAGGFLTDRPADLDQPSPRRSPAQRMARFLNTLDAHWSDADRLVRAIYRKGGRLAFHPIAVTAQMLLALAGVAALTAGLRDGHPIELHAAAGHVPLLLGVNLVAIAVHELAHALVLVHYGRSVQSAGFRLHLGTPAFYVESVDAILLTRRQRITQAAAGPWAEWLVTSIVAISLWHSPWAFVIPVLLRFVILNTLTIASNLIPFVGLDGYWILSDIVREPGLSRRSKRAVIQLGRDLRARHLPHGEDVVLSAYATMNALIAGALVMVAIFFWYQLFGDCLTRLTGLGPVGWFAVIALLGILVRPTVLALTPVMSNAIVSARRLHVMVRFRLERRWRVRGTERLHALPAFRHLDARSLEHIAGRLERIPLEKEGFKTHGGTVVLISRRACRRRVDAIVLPQRWTDEITAPSPVSSAVSTSRPTDPHRPPVGVGCWRGR